MPDDKVSAALYAIYAFQLTILPLIVWVVLLQAFVKGRIRLHPIAIAITMPVGFAVAWFSATKSELLAPYFEKDSLYVIPPLLVVVVCVILFGLLNTCLLRKS
jgi:hypothetical protein